MIQETIKGVSHLRRRYHLLQLRRNAQRLKPGSQLRCLNYTVRINDGPNFYILYKDIFIKRIYHFEAKHPDPFILDCGSNIGMSILYFKHIYPKARIIGFEPDLAVFPYLKENITRNNLSDVQVVKAALVGGKANPTFYADGKYGGHLARYSSGTAQKEGTKYEADSVRLRDYLAEPVDFLKINIEGAEYEVLADCGEFLPKVQEMVIEYHHLPGLPRTLHKILDLLHRQGFEYLINDFDSESNPEVNTPFRLTPESRYFLLIYAKRTD